MAGMPGFAPTTEVFAVQFWQVPDAQLGVRKFVSQICVLGAGLAEICVLVNESALMPNPFGAPERTSAAACPRYSSGEVLADSASLQWPGLFVRRSRFPRTVDRFLVPATPEPVISCVLAGSARGL